MTRPICFTVIAESSRSQSQLYGYQSDLLITNKDRDSVLQEQTLSELLEAVGIESDRQKHWEWTIKSSLPVPLAGKIATAQKDPSTPEHQVYSNGLSTPEHEVYSKGIGLNTLLKDFMINAVLIYGRLKDNRSQNPKGCLSSEQNAVTASGCLDGYLAQHMGYCQKVDISRVVIDNTDSLKVTPLQKAELSTPQEPCLPTLAESEEKQTLISATVVAGEGDCSESVFLNSGIWQISKPASTQQYNFDLVLDSCQVEPSALQIGQDSPIVLALEPVREQLAISSMTVHRSLRTNRAIEPQLNLPSPIPKRPKKEYSFPWVQLLVPVAIAALLAWLFQPIYAIFALIGAVGVLGRYGESVWRHSKDKKRYRSDKSRYEQDYQQALEAYRKDCERYRWLNQPGVAELYRASQGRESLWERRISDDDALIVTLGVGFDEIERIGSQTGELLEQLKMGFVTHVHPMLPTGLGLYGNRTQSLGLARSVICQLATLHGPADLSFVIVANSDSKEERGLWDWLKWLPHRSENLTSDHSLELADSASTLTRSRPFSQSALRADSATNNECVLVIVDNVEADVAAVVNHYQTCSKHVVVLALAQRCQDLPRDCASQFSVENYVVKPRDVIAAKEPCVASVISLQRATDWARNLSAFRDPEVIQDSESFSTESLTLFEALELSEASIACDYRPDWAQCEQVNTVQRRCGPNRGLKAVLGAGPQGRLEVDFAIDGPHMLIAGMTGSGKSDFLRALITSLAHSYSPDELVFLLADFKGGGTMDSCAPLAHVAGVITDLEPEQVERAIASITRELSRREQLLRDCGARDYDQAQDLLTEPLPRLMVIIDEFAVLAGEYQMCLDNIVDLAARGRSLGMHLILATQHPSGVVSSKLRANTNMCLSFRTRCQADSIDVIGVGDAGNISHHKPGQAYLVTGSLAPVPFRATACNSRLMATNSQDTATPITVRAFELHNVEVPVGDIGGVLNSQDPSPQHSSANNEAESPAWVTIDEHHLLTSALIAYGAKYGLRTQQMWFEPLCAELEWETLHQQLEADPYQPDSASLTLGLYDRHDHSDEHYFKWRYKAGGIAFYVSSKKCSSQIVETLIAASSQQAELAEVYVIQNAAAKDHTKYWPHVVDVIDATDRERIGRLLNRLESRDSTSAMKLVIIDGIGALDLVDDPLYSAQIFDRLDRLVRNPKHSKVTLAAIASAPNRIPSKLGQSITQRLLLKLSDPNGGLLLGVGHSKYKDLPELRALDIGTDTVVQLAKAPTSQIATELKAKTVAVPVGPVGQLPQTLTVSDLEEVLFTLERATVEADTESARISTELVNSEQLPPTVDPVIKTIPIALSAHDLEPLHIQLHNNSTYSQKKGVCTLVVGPATTQRHFLTTHIAKHYLETARTSKQYLQTACQSSTESGSCEPASIEQYPLEMLVKDDLIIIRDCDVLDQRQLKELRGLLEHNKTANVLIGMSTELYGSMTSPITPVRSRSQIIALGSEREFPVLSAQYKQRRSNQLVPVTHKRNNGYLRKITDLESGTVEYVQFIEPQR